MDGPPVDDKAIHQGIDELSGIAVGTVGQMGIPSGGQNTVVTESFLDFEQVASPFYRQSSAAAFLRVSGFVQQTNPADPKTATCFSVGCFVALCKTFVLTYVPKGVQLVKS